MDTSIDRKKQITCDKMNVRQLRYRLVRKAVHPPPPPDKVTHLKDRIKCASESELSFSFCLDKFGLFEKNINRWMYIYTLKLNEQFKRLYEMV